MELFLQLVVVVRDAKTKFDEICSISPPIQYNRQGRRYEMKSQPPIEEAMASSKRAQKPVCFLLFS